MVQNILGPIVESDTTELVRYDVHHALPNNTNSLIGKTPVYTRYDDDIIFSQRVLLFE